MVDLVGLEQANLRIWFTATHAQGSFVSESLNATAGANAPVALGVAANKLTFATTTGVDGGVLIETVRVLNFSGLGISAAAGGVAMTGTLRAPQIAAASFDLLGRDYDTPLLPFTVKLAPATPARGGCNGLRSSNRDRPTVVLQYDRVPTRRTPVQGRSFAHARFRSRLRAAIAGVLRLIALIKLPEGPPAPDYPTRPDAAPALEHLGRFLSSCVRWLARELGGAGYAVFGLLEAAVDAAGRVLEVARSSAQNALSHVSIEARLDADTLALRQIVVTPLRKDGSPAARGSVDLVGFHLDLPNDARPSLVIDLTQGAPVVTPSGAITLSTDLWLDRGSCAEAASAKSDNLGQPADRRPLIAITLTTARPIALVALSGAQPRFFQELVIEGAPSSASHSRTSACRACISTSC